MVDVRTIQAKDQTEALAKARIEFGVNFSILSTKNIKTKGFLGIGSKSECQLRIMLLDSIYDSRKRDDREKENDDKREMAKHSAVIDGKEMGERIVHINNALQNSSRERLEQTILLKQDELKNNREKIQEERKAEEIKDAYNNEFKTLNKNQESYDDIEKKVNALLEKKLQGYIEQHLKDKTSTNKTQISDYLESSELGNKLDSARNKNKIENINNNEIAKTYHKKNTPENIDDLESSLKELRRREFPEDMIDDIKEYLLTSSNARFFQSKEVIQTEIEKYFRDRLLFHDGIDVTSRKKIVVLVGPTGVGKTTTIPKIAAIHLKSSKKVSFITIDNYRIAAVDQMQKYADIMKIPFAQATTPDELRSEVRKMEANSLLFVDTMGRSPKGAEDIVALSKYFSAVGRFDVDIQLVMSATIKYNDAVNILDAFKITNYKGVILTKLDETDYTASSISAICKANVPITYATFGQRVPKDIATGVKYKTNILNGLCGKIK